MTTRERKGRGGVGLRPGHRWILGLLWIWPALVPAQTCEPQLLAADRRGPVVALERSGPTLWAASGAALSRFDVAIPAAPVESGYVHFDGLAIDVADAGALVVVLTRSELVFVDGGDPQQLQIAGSWPIPESWLVRGVDAVGNIALVPADDGLHVVDFSDPQNAVEVGLLAQAPARAVVVATPQRAYLAADNALHVVDIGTPAAPSVVATLALPGSGAQEITGSPDGGRLALWANLRQVHHDWAELWLVDLADPDAPELDYHGVSEENRIGAVTVEGNRAYVGGRIFDIDDPTAPSFAGMLVGGWIADHATSGNPGTLFVASGDLLVEGVSDPGSVALLAAVEHPEASVDAYVAGSIVVVLDRGGIRTFAATGDTGRLPQIGSLRLPDDFPRQFARLGDHAVVHSGGAPDYLLRLIDLSDPTTPKAGATLESTLQRPLVDPPLLLVGLDCVEGVGIWDASVPAAPVRLGEIELSTNCWDVDFAADGNHLYFWDFDEAEPDYVQKLSTFDLTDPANPELLAAVLVEEHRGSSVARGRQLLLAEADALEVFDLSDPAAPSRLGGVPLPSSNAGSQRPISLYGSHLAVATRSASIGLPGVDLRPRIVDVSDPASPLVVAELATPGTAEVAALGPGVVVVADGFGGVSLFESCAPFADGFEAGDLAEWGFGGQ